MFNHIRQKKIVRISVAVVFIEGGYILCGAVDTIVGNS